MEIIIDIVLDAVLDSLKLIPFLLVTYLVMEWIEHKAQARTVQAIESAGAAGPAIGALLGAVPQCGFSAMASTFYAGRVITLGTLIAVFLSTSDEMLPVFIAEQVEPGLTFAVLAAKVAIGMVCGFAVDAVMRATHRAPTGMRIHDLCQDENCYCEERCAGESASVLPQGDAEHTHGAPDDASLLGREHEHEHEHHDADHCHHEHGTGSIVLSAVKHTLQITLFIFLITLALNACIEWVGEDAFAAFISSNEALSVAACGLVGLIPNCAASVLIADLYVKGVLSTGAMMAGLLPAAGIGLLVLLRTNRQAKENALIIAGIFAIGVVCGLLINALGL